MPKAIGRSLTKSGFLSFKEILPTTSGAILSTVMTSKCLTISIKKIINWSFARLSPGHLRCPRPKGIIDLTGMEK